MNKKKYRQLDISGDVGLRIWGENLEGIFQNAAEGLYNLVTDTATISGSENRKVHVMADRKEDLLIKWLNELVFLIDAHGFVGKGCTVTIQDNSLKAIITGGILHPDFSEKRLLIKAATYHSLSLKKINALWEATVVFDI